MPINPNPGDWDLFFLGPLKLTFKADLALDAIAHRWRQNKPDPVRIGQEGSVPTPYFAGQWFYLPADYDILYYS